MKTITNTPDLSSLAHRLANAAGEIARGYFRQDLSIETKADLSPVTIANREIELAIREIIVRERPDDGILGEEFGAKESRNGLTWVIDPMTGTKSFVMGRPTFGTLIALCENGVPVLGVIDQPILKERWLGTKGAPTLFNGRPVRTRPCPSLENAAICSTTPAMFRDTGPVYEAFDGGRKMAWGGDCYAYGLMACGFVDVIIEASLSPYDFCALVPVVEGAGGIITDWDGNSLTIQSAGKIVAAGDRTLHGAVLERIRAFAG